MSANNYSSSDEASSGSEISDWTDGPEENRYSLDRFEEEQIEGYEILGKVGRIMKRKAAVAPPVRVETLSSQKIMKDGICSYLATFEMAGRYGCFVHYARALYRRVRKLGLVQIYKQEGRFSVFFDALKSLVYVPPDDVTMAYKPHLHSVHVILMAVIHP
uniref:Uncharacterized protein n=1 Tax=Ditylenchus dipsaci TaxID=166011 RepID=A0A915D9H2_9BILA